MVGWPLTFKLWVIIVQVQQAVIQKYSGRTQVQQ